MAVSAERDAPAVEIHSLIKRFRRRDGVVVNAIDDTSLTIARGEFVVLLGPSGCGKTTLLRCIAGLEKADAGRIAIDGHVVFDSVERIALGSEHRGLAMIFQSYALWPHMTAFGNVAYPLTCLKPRPAAGEIEERVMKVLHTVGIGELAHQYPNQMSGGQQQRVALARALVVGASVVLFDEPLSNVDAKVREQLRFEMRLMQKELGFAAVYVTHDQSEAMQLADRIAVLEQGRIVHLAAPRDIYEEPVSRYVANFIGTTNEIEGVVEDAEGAFVNLHTAVGPLCGQPGPGLTGRGSAVVAVWRPERCELLFAAPREPAPNVLPGVIEVSLYCGTHVEHVVRVGGADCRVWSNALHLHPAGTQVWIRVAAADLRVLPQ